MEVTGNRDDRSGVIDAGRNGVAGRGLQVTGRVLMVRPMRFGFNRETATSNTLQRWPVIGAELVHQRALAEFDCVAGKLLSYGVDVQVAEDTDQSDKPDAIFPNNWVSFHDDGTVVLYPLQAASRRAERRRDIVAWLTEEGGFEVRRIVDLSWLEQRAQYLEGTGSLVLDRPAMVAYAALSPRTHPAALVRFGEETGFRVETFRTREENGIPLYHTNVMLSLGDRFAVVCAEAIAEAWERRRVLRTLADSGRDVVMISMVQLGEFAANLLQLRARHDSSMILLSERARRSLHPEQLSVLARHGELVAVAVETIEQVGGGGVRCMLAEIFLPQAV